VTLAREMLSAAELLKLGVASHEARQPAPGSRADRSSTSAN
jgi:hypothetical protein